MSVHESALKKVMARVFEISEEQITTESSPDTLEQWDSLKHMELIVEIENYFEIELPEIAIIESLNFELILLWIARLKE
jgi:acyl carrier protein